MTFCCERAKAAQKRWQKRRLTLRYPYCSSFTSSERWSSPWSTGKGALPSVARADISPVCSGIAPRSVFASLISTSPALAHSAAPRLSALENLAAKRSCQSARPRSERALDIQQDCFRRSVNSSWEKVRPAQYTTGQREDKQSQKTTPISRKHSPQVKLQATENQIALPLKTGLPRGCWTHQSDNGYTSLNIFPE